MYNQERVVEVLIVFQKYIFIAIKIKMSMLSDIDEEVFIDKIKKFPALYNDQHSDYTNRSKKEELWQELSEYMDKSGKHKFTNKQNVYCKRPLFQNNVRYCFKKSWFLFLGIP